jgi:hypothetical protein
VDDPSSEEPLTALFVLVIIAAFALLVPRWGPGTHILLASRMLDADAERAPLEVPSELRRLITAYAPHFLYGNIAADIINFKKYGGLKDHCHNWNMKERLGEHADTDAEQAFVLGYLCHLAADVVAHNHFVPYQLVHGLPPRLLGHLYWEARADGRVPEAHWETIDGMRLDRSLHENDRLIAGAVPRRALSLTANKAIFNNVLLARSRRSWRGIMDQMKTLSPRGHLDRDFMATCIEACFRNMHAVFRDDTLAELRELDPNGHAALTECIGMRRHLLEEHGNRSAAADASRGVAEKRFGFAAKR